MITLYQCCFYSVDINSTTGELYVAASLDYEREQLFLVEVIASDNPGGSSHNMETQFITIRVEDINDNSPVFTQSLYTVTVKENEDVFNFTVTAYDSDSGQFIIFSAHQLL